MPTSKTSFVYFGALALLGACATSSTPPAGDAGGDSSSGDGGPSGGPVSGAQDAHCSGKASQPVRAASCHPEAGAADASAPGSDAGDDGGGAGEYGPTEFNAEGDDDDCKYHLAWTSTPIRQQTDVTFTVVITQKADNTPMRPLPGEGSGVYPVRAELFLNDTHPGPNTRQTAVETSTPGTYTVGPVRFDDAGQWTVRFHTHEMCEDAFEDSPHGHAAFFVQIP